MNKSNLSKKNTVRTIDDMFFKHYLRQTSEKRKYDRYNSQYYKKRRHKTFRKKK